MIRLTDLLNENYERILRDVKKLSKLYGLKEVPKDKAEKFPDNSAPSGDPEIVTGFQKKTRDSNEYAIVYDNGDIKSIIKGGQWSRTSSIDPSDLEYEWHSEFGIGGMGGEVGDIHSLFLKNPQAFSKYRKGDSYIDVPLKLLDKFGLDKRDLEHTASEYEYGDSVKMDNRTYSLVFDD